MSNNKYKHTQNYTHKNNELCKKKLILNPSPPFGHPKVSHLILFVLIKLHKKSLWSCITPINKHIKGTKTYTYTHVMYMCVDPLNLAIFEYRNQIIMKEYKEDNPRSPIIIYFASFKAFYPGDWIWKGYFVFI